MTVTSAGHWFNVKISEFNLFYVENAVRNHYNIANFLENTHNRHPLAHPWRQGMGVFCECNLWFVLYLDHYCCTELAKRSCSYKAVTILNIIFENISVDRNWHILVSSKIAYVYQFYTAYSGTGLSPVQPTAWRWRRTSLLATSFTFMLIIDIFFLSCAHLSFQCSIVTLKCSYNLEYRYQSVCTKCPILKIQKHAKWLILYCYFGWP